MSEQIRRFACRDCGELFMQDVNNPENVNDKILMFLCPTTCRLEEVNRRLLEGYDPDLDTRHFL